MKEATAMWMKSFLTRASLTALLASPGAVAQAASLQVAPVLVEVQAPAAAATLKLRNEGDRPLDAQIRIFRWTQVDGVDTLTPTNDVAASPPLASLRPNTDYTVRIVRTAKEPVVNEESYRLLIDEIPAAAAAQTATVKIALRYSIPVFFTAPAVAAPKLSWDLQQRDKKPAIVVSNAGSRRIRLAKLKFTDGKGGTADFGDGLAGYVLGRSTRVFAVPAKAKGFGTGGVVAISAQSDIGPIDAKR
jgi:fimbrial chaperone protein